MNRANLKTVCLITNRIVEEELPVCVVATFRLAYKIALFKQQITYPNLTERAALRVLNRTGKVILWDTKQFKYEDEARWSVNGRMSTIQKIPVITK